jgi:hypothetical protein
MTATYHLPHGTYRCTGYELPLYRLFSAVADAGREMLRPAAPRRPRVEDRTGACCLLAVRRYCVCSGSWQCPTHGTLCRGSHE